MEFKTLLKSVVCLAIGFGGGYYYANSVLREEYENKVQEEVESIREVMGRRKPKVEETEESKEQGKTVDEYERQTQKYRNYNDCSSKDEIRAEKEAGAEASLTEEVQGRDRDGDAYQIVDVQFAEENQHYDKITLYYYTVDDVLTGENEEIIDDRERLLGVYEIESEDPGEAYYRNERLMIDYEVIIIYGAYKTIVMGDDEE